MSLIILFFFSPLLVFAQDDVCCIVAKISGSDVETAALPMSNMECKPGLSGGFEGFKVCTGVPDPTNECPSFKAKDRCKACGYFWNGDSCLIQDPVEKAKEALKKEMGKSE